MNFVNLPQTKLRKFARNFRWDGTYYKRGSSYALTPSVEEAAKNHLFPEAKEEKKEEVKKKDEPVFPDPSTDSDE